MRDLKINMRKRARISAGMLNLLRDDIEQIRVDTNDFDLICLEESVRDAKLTLQMLVDNVTEIEYMLYLAKSNNA